MEENNDLDIENKLDVVAENDSEMISDESVTAEAIDGAAEMRETRTVGSSNVSGGGSSLPKMILLFGVIIAVGAGLVFWKNKVAGQHGDESYDISKEEMEILVKDFPPMQRKQLAENPEQKKQLVDNVKELLSIATQAKKEGYANDPLVKHELEFSEKAMYAANYDKKLNSDKGPMPQFGFITEDQVKAFWGGDADMSGLNWIWNGAKSRRHEAEFQSFLDTKIKLAQKSGQIAKDQKPSEDEISQAKGAFAKTMIYHDEAKDKLANLASLPAEEQEEWKKWKEATELQIKLQSAQFLTQNYVREVLSKKFVVTNEDVTKYLAEHPELANDGEKKKQAEELLAKIKNGGDFAELAKEFSDDPGSKNKGGLLEGIGKGQFAAEFEAAVLAVKPGEVVDTVVKTEFGYHIIKLENTGEAKGANGNTQPTYDARHILISTMVKDPDNPAAREQPVEKLAKSKLEKEKQQQILDEVKANNPVQVAEDFEIPEVTEEELEKEKENQKKMMQQRMQQQGGPQGQAPPPPPAPAPKK